MNKAALEIAIASKREGWSKGVFDSEAIVRLANSSKIKTPQALANKLGIPLDGRLKRRLNWLVTKDELIGSEFLAY